MHPRTGNSGSSNSSAAAGKLGGTYYPASGYDAGIGYKKASAQPSSGAASARLRAGGAGPASPSSRSSGAAETGGSTRAAGVLGSRGAASATTALNGLANGRASRSGATALSSSSASSTPRDLVGRPASVGRSASSSTVRPARPLSAPRSTPSPGFNRSYAASPRLRYPTADDGEDSNDSTPGYRSPPSRGSPSAPRGRPHSSGTSGGGSASVSANTRALLLAGLKRTPVSDPRWQQGGASAGRPSSSDGGAGIGSGGGSSTSAFAYKSYVSVRSELLQQQQGSTTAAVAARLAGGAASSMVDPLSSQGAGSYIRRQSQQLSAGSAAAAKDRVGGLALSGGGSIISSVLGAGGSGGGALPGRAQPAQSSSGGGSLLDAAAGMTAAAGSRPLLRMQSYSRGSPELSSGLRSPGAGAFTRAGSTPPELPTAARVRAAMERIVSRRTSGAGGTDALAAAGADAQRELARQMSADSSEDRWRTSYSVQRHLGLGLGLGSPTAAAAAAAGPPISPASSLPTAPPQRPWEQGAVAGAGVGSAALSRHSSFGGAAVGAGGLAPRFSLASDLAQHGSGPLRLTDGGADAVAAAAASIRAREQAGSTAAGSGLFSSALQQHRQAGLEAEGRLRQEYLEQQQRRQEEQLRLYEEQRRRRQQEEEEQQRQQQIALQQQQRRQQEEEERARQRRQLQREEQARRQQQEEEAQRRLAIAEEQARRQQQEDEARRRLQLAEEQRRRRQQEEDQQRLLQQRRQREEEEYRLQQQQRRRQQEEEEELKRQQQQRQYERLPSSDRERQQRELHVALTSSGIGGGRRGGQSEDSDVSEMSASLSSGCDDDTGGSSAPRSPPQQQPWPVSAARGPPSPVGAGGSGAPPRGSVGLTNLGNTCFINAVLQCLNCVPELVGRLLASVQPNSRERPEWAVAAARGGAVPRVAPALAQLLSDVWAGGRGPVNPKGFLRTVSAYEARWGEGYQQDCEEFLHSLLTAMQTECNRVRSKPVYRELTGKGTEAEQAEDARAYHASWHDSIVEDVFVGQLQSTVACAGCGGASHCFDPFCSLALPLPASGAPVAVEDLLASFVQREELGATELYNCTHCGPKQPASKRLQIWSYPPDTLVVTLKRFASTGANHGSPCSFSCGLGSPGGGGRFSAARKVSTPLLLRRGATLDLSPFCNPAGLRECAARGRPPPVYRLVAVADHSGTLGGGHYTARGRSHMDGRWYRFDDSRVTPCDEPDGPSSEAYVLLYRLVRPRGSPTRRDSRERRGEE